MAMYIYHKDNNLTNYLLNCYQINKCIVYAKINPNPSLVGSIKTTDYSTMGSSLPFIFTYEQMLDIYNTNREVLQPLNDVDVEFNPSSYLENVHNTNLKIYLNRW